MSMTLVLQQILIIFCYVAVGLGAGKLGIINPEQRKYLTKLCSGLILPFTILSAASMEIGGEARKSWSPGLLCRSCGALWSTSESGGGGRPSELPASAPGSLCWLLGTLRRSKRCWCLRCWIWRHSSAV